MISSKMKWIVGALVVLIIFAAGFVILNNSEKASTADQNIDTAASSLQSTDVAQASSLPSPASSYNNKVIYVNNQYGFNFTLPLDWKNYSIVESKWEGLAIGGAQGEKVVETGPIISIRDPRWTPQTPRQDIPIMVFTLSQWNSLQQGKFHIGAAPIGPSELGRNDKYVFALPARYNYAFPPGYEEVETILKSNPLKATQNYSGN